MMRLRTKLYLVATPFAIISASLAGISTTVDNGQDAFLVRLALWITLFGFSICLVTWALHRVGLLQLDLEFMETRLTAAEKRADDAEERANGLEARILKLEDELKCRDLAKRLLSGSDDAELLRTLLHVEDVEDRN